MAKRSFNGTAAQPKAGVLTEILRNAQLAWHLLTDRRVSLLPKLIIPGLMLGYLIFPVDLLPDFVPVLGQLDDLAILALGIKLFIELSPKRDRARVSGRSQQRIIAGRAERQCRHHRRGLPRGEVTSNE